MKRMGVIGKLGNVKAVGSGNGGKWRVPFDRMDVVTA